MAKQSNIQSLLRNAHLLPALYEQHIGKAWDTSKPIMECAQALARKGVTINRRGASAGTSEGNTNLNATKADRVNSRIRGAVRSALDKAWENGKATHSFIYGESVVNVTIETNGQIATLTVKAGDTELYAGNDYQAAYHRIFKHYDL